MKSLLLKVLLCCLPLAACLGEETSEHVPVVVLGGGVGALTSALYLARASLSPLVIEGKIPGGLLTQSHSIQNWPGEMEIEGSALMEKMRKQVVANGARLFSEEVVAIDFSKRPLMIETRPLFAAKEVRHKIFADTCIIAMGTQPNLLRVPGEATYWGRGVSNCAPCDGALYKGKVVGVVGGGDSAVLEALYLSEIAKEVLVFVRGKELKGVEAQRKDALLLRPNVKFLYQTTVEAILGDGDTLSQVRIRSQGQEPHAVPLDGLFLAIGSTPNTALFRSALALDAKGYIALTKEQETSLKGVFAIGDIVDPIYKQATSAAGGATKAAFQVQRYLSERSKGLLTKREEVAKKAAIPFSPEQVVEIVALDQFERELKGGTPVVVDFYATWCAPCTRLSPLFELSAHQLAGKVKFLKVNVEKFTPIALSYGIRSMPTVVLLDETGKILEKKVGTEEISSLLKRLEK